MNEVEQEVKEIFNDSILQAGAVPCILRFTPSIV
ncbi:hypothetical protein PM3016_2578 [Paenibacillus mucilaginosus 3016]|uniref:Uncharacterized protein n=2 Tax=Paenibacillus mucilaginosus TaxID=61624 RepID=H6NCY0_9BACL|nr:hypothetical protein PM3016_2578 [Paenibacillus mucilaginosus 3016]AFH61639.1 hypothetical protein B2K_13075 [Paenibacillus mucilaginosus K02]